MRLPVTRYYGSKRRLLDKIWDALAMHQIEFDSILDLFGGTGIVSYYMAHKGKDIIYNDILSFNCEIAKALLCSSRGSFTETDALALLQRVDGREYQNIIAQNFHQVYYTPDEDEIIDIVVQNIHYLEDEKKASAYYVLFQSCMIKRPFNLFHRKNLNLRTNFVKANFGNKVTWEQSFKDLFLKFTKELNEFQFEALPNVDITNTSALECDKRADLVYIDTPYFPKKDVGGITYHSRYHFLEGLMNYAEIPDNIDRGKVNLEIGVGKNWEFEKRSNYINELDELIYKHRDSIIALSYTTEGYPSIQELEEIIHRHKQTTHVCYLGKHGFALNRNNADRQEVLIIGL